MLLYPHGILSIMITENTIVKVTLGGGEDPMEKLTRLIIERDELNMPFSEGNN